MRRLLKYILIYPIVSIIDLVDSLIGFIYLDEWLRRKDRHLPGPNDVHSVAVNVTDTAITYRSASGQTSLFRLDEDDANLYEIVCRSASAYADVNILGYREIVAVEEEMQPSSGKMLKKFRMKNEYSWITYREMIERVDNLANGLLKIGLKSNDKIVIFAETRPEWLISAIACFKIKVPVVTLYATLGIYIFPCFGHVIFMNQKLMFTFITNYINYSFIFKTKRKLNFFLSKFSNF